MTELREIELDNGLLAWDGRVLERFGFGLPGQEPTRPHVREIERIELKGGRLKVEGRGRSSINARLEFDDARQAELEEFLEQVRSAAPNLKG